MKGEHIYVVWLWCHHHQGMVLRSDIYTYIYIYTKELDLLMRMYNSTITCFSWSSIVISQSLCFISAVITWWNVNDTVFIDRSFDEIRVMICFVVISNVRSFSRISCEFKIVIWSNFQIAILCSLCPKKIRVIAIILNCIPRSRMISWSCQIYHDQRTSKSWYVCCS